MIGRYQDTAFDGRTEHRDTQADQPADEALINVRKAPAPT